MIKLEVCHLPNHISQVSSPEWQDPFISEGPHSAVYDTIVWLVKTSSFKHFSLVLNKQLDSLDGSWGCLWDASSNPTQHESLHKVELMLFIFRHLEIETEIKDTKFWLFCSTCSSYMWRLSRFDLYARIQYIMEYEHVRDYTMVNSSWTLAVIHY